MAANAFQKFKDSTSRAITKISVKTSSSLEKSKLKMRIDTLNKDIQLLCTSVGENVYVLWVRGQSANQDVINKLEAIKQKKAEVAQLNAEMNAIDERDNEILGRPEYAQSVPMQAAPVQAAPVQAAPVQAAPVQAAPVQEAPAPVEPVVQEAPVQEAPAAAAACPNCGEPHDGVAKFCRKCGFNLQG